MRADSIVNMCPSQPLAERQHDIRPGCIPYTLVTSLVVVVTSVNRQPATWFPLPVPGSSCDAGYTLKRQKKRNQGTRGQSNTLFSKQPPRRARVSIETRSRCEVVSLTLTP